MTDSPPASVERARIKASLLRSMFHKDAAPPKIGRFSVHETLGRGGMGVVYRCYDPELKREVAIKLLGSRPGEDESQGRSRLLREAQAMARLSHPNVLPVFEAGQVDGRVFMVMELVEGGTLLDWAQAEARGWDEVLALYVQAARGLQAAHAAGLVHRDFKPHNVLVAEGPRARVMDFGLARPSDEVQLSAAESVPEGDVGALDTPLTRTGTVLGTPAYMSPEQHHGRVADAQSDQFSFCVALWEALYGERPYAGSTMGALLEAIESERRELPGKSEVPIAVRRVLERGLAVAPQERWPSMEAIADALEALRPGAKRSRAGWWALGDRNDGGWTRVRAAARAGAGIAVSAARGGDDRDPRAHRRGAGRAQLAHASPQGSRNIRRPFQAVGGRVRGCIHVDVRCDRSST